jgi:hypothetical protein
VVVDELVDVDSPSFSVVRPLSLLLLVMDVSLVVMLVPVVVLVDVVVVDDGASLFMGFFPSSISLADS